MLVFLNLCDSLCFLFGDCVLGLEFLVHSQCLAQVLLDKFYACPSSELSRGSPSRIHSHHPPVAGFIELDVLVELPAYQVTDLRIEFEDLIGVPD